MFYIGLGNVKQNIQRVAQRVENGGHDIPVKDILRREETSIQNPLNNLQLIDNLIILDNGSYGANIVIQISGGNVIYKSNHIPGWSLPILNKFNV